MSSLRPTFLPFFLFVLLFSHLHAEPVKVRHLEGVTLGFLVLRTLQGQTIAYGEMQQVVHADGLVMDDLQFRFEDGSYYREITKFTQKDHFRLVSDQVEQKGPSFKEDSESWIDAVTGKITVRTVHNGKEKQTTKHLDLPPDVSNGLINTLLKNIDPSVPDTTVSMVATSTSPRVVELHISPAQEKALSVGTIHLKAQHFVVKVKIKGVAGIVAPLVGKQPPDLQVWIAKSEAPTFVESEGPLTGDSPAWRIEVTAPPPESGSSSPGR